MTVAPSAVRIKKASGWQDMAIVGPPGPPGGEYELAYASNTADVAINSTSAGGITLVTLPSVTFDGNTTVSLEFWSRAVQPGGAVGAVVYLSWYMDGVQVGSSVTPMQNPTTQTVFYPCKVETRITPTAGAHVFSLRGWYSGGAAGVVFGGQTPGSAMFARIVRVMPPPTVPGGLFNAGANVSVAMSVATQNIPNGTFTPITWGIERIDTDNMWDVSAPTRLTCTKDGYYVVSGTVDWEANTVGRRVTRLRKNGTEVASVEQYASGGSGYLNQDFTFGPISLVVGDYVDIVLYQDSGGNKYIGQSFTVCGMWQTNPKLLSSPPPAIPLVSSLPASPVDGQEVYYLADATNGVIWHLRYRASSSSAYKWEYVGGPPLSAQVETDQATSSTTFVTLGGPSISIPLAGDYTIDAGYRGYAGGASQNFNASVKKGAAAAADADMIADLTGGTFTGASVARRYRMNALAASTILEIYYRSGGAYNSDFLNRWLTVQPVRVG